MCPRIIRSRLLQGTPCLVFCMMYEQCHCGLTMTSRGGSCLLGGILPDVVLDVPACPPLANRHGTAIKTPGRRKDKYVGQFRMTDGDGGPHRPTSLADVTQPFVVRLPVANEEWADDYEYADTAKPLISTHRSLHF